MIYLCNTLSVFMLDRFFVGDSRELSIERISAIRAGKILKGHAFRSFYGHQESAGHLSRYLRIKIPVSRGAIKLTENDILIVAAIDSKRAWEMGLKPCPKWKFFMVKVKGEK